jgi:hypothetical protein
MVRLARLAACGAALALALGLAGASSARAQDAGARAPIVLVVDPGPLRIVPDRMVRAVSTALARDVVRVTDPRASAAAGTLTVAYRGRQTWLVRYDDGHGHVATAEVSVPRPGRLSATIARAATPLVADVEGGAAGLGAPSATPTAREADEPTSMWLASASEILDPFVGLPRPTTGTWHLAGYYSEVIDPFAPPGTVRSMPEVLDPWQP